MITHGSGTLTSGVASRQHVSRNVPLFGFLYPPVSPAPTTGQLHHMEKLTKNSQYTASSGYKVQLIRVRRNPCLDGFGKPGPHQNANYSSGSSYRTASDRLASRSWDHKFTMKLALFVVASWKCCTTWLQTTDTQNEYRV